MRTYPTTRTEVVRALNFNTFIRDDRRWSFLDASAVAEVLGVTPEAIYKHVRQLSADGILIPTGMRIKRDGGTGRPGPGARLFEYPYRVMVSPDGEIVTRATIWTAADPLPSTNEEGHNND